MSTVFNSIISTLKYLFMCVGYNVKQSVNNKKSFIIQTIAMFINNFVFIFFWQILFNNKGGNINGITMSDILYLWSIPTIGFGIAFFCFGGIETLCQDIVNGNLDLYLTRPKNSLISTLTSRSILSAMGDLLFGILCGILAVNFNPLKILLILIMGIFSAVLNVAVLTSVRLLSFWLGDISTACHKYTHSLLITLTIYPENMFPAVIKFVMYTIIPAGYIAHAPIKVITESSITWFIVLILATAFFVTLTCFLYKKGLKKYQG
jgi:ABC-2 type transport system permease protein